MKAFLIQKCNVKNPSDSKMEASERLLQQAIVYCLFGAQSLMWTLYGKFLLFLNCERDFVQITLSRNMIVLLLHHLLILMRTHNWTECVLVILLSVTLSLKKNCWKHNRHFLVGLFGCNNNNNFFKHNNNNITRTWESPTTLISHTPLSNETKNTR